MLCLRDNVITFLARIRSVVRERRGWGCSGSYSCRCSDKNVRDRRKRRARGRTNLAARLVVGGRSGGLDPIELGLLVEGWLSLDWKRPRIDGGCDCFSGEKGDGALCACESLSCDSCAAILPRVPRNVFFFMLTSPVGKVVLLRRVRPHLASGAIMGTNPFLSYLPDFCVCKKRLRLCVAIRYFI